MNDNPHNQVFRPSSVEGNATVIHRSDLLFNRLLSVQKTNKQKVLSVSKSTTNRETTQMELR